ncbi:MAG: T9SS type A sorting domain-containing protein [Nonlabens sp.]|uniref:T9SS type A sorting domain-containing protein n=1 Tax=Nonlabens sp. TaxID=1888209 RepID=UPI003EF76BE4
MVYSNYNNSIEIIRIDFNDGAGYRVISLDTDIYISYNSGGEKDIKVEFNYSNGEQLRSHSYLYVNYINPNAPLSYDGGALLWDRVLITGADYQGASASGQVTIELAPGHTQLTKPLIVVEGFDPDGSFNYFSLINSTGAGGLNIIIDNSTSLTLNQAIEDEGYDLVFVDYVNGTDFIQRNAFMVEEVIRRVNLLKVGSEKNVVLGISMGGLVSRYALRHMEINNETHETKLYISHDSPHQGANVPLAAQALVRHLVGEQVSLPVFLSLFNINLTDVNDLTGEEELAQGLAILESPAAKQMLIYQINGTGQNLSHPSTTLHDTFLTEYQNMGYPQQDNIRNVAITNSTDCGTPLEFEPLDDLINADITIDLPYFFTNLGLAGVNVLSLNPGRIVSSLLSTNTDVKVEINCKALPSEQIERIYRGKVYISKTILGIFEEQEHFIDPGAFYSNNNMLALDSSNGGIYDINTLAQLPALAEEYVLETQFSFIPVYSSLDIGEGFVDITPPDLLKKYDATMPPPAPKYVPFDNFHANPFISQAHTQFTLENGNWLIEELKGTPFSESCALACEIDSWAIEGPDIFCGNGSYTLPPGAFEYNWSFPGVTNSDPLTPHIVSVQEHLNGYQTIAATINLPDCNYSRTITKIVYAGVPETGGTLIQVDPNTIPNLSISGETYCTSTGVIITNWPGFEHVTNIEMQKISGQSDWDGEYRSGRDLRTVISSNCNEVFEFEVRVENQCGWSEWEYFSVDITGCPNTCPPVSNSGNIVSENFVISPVPANDWLGIDMVDNPNWTFFTIDCGDSTTDPNGNTNCPTYVGVKLYDFEGNLVIDKPSHQLGSAVDVSALSPGTYILHVSHAGQLETHQIPIN